MITASFYVMDDLITLFSSPWFLVFLVPIIGAALSALLAKFSPQLRNIIAILSTGLAATLALVMFVSGLSDETYWEEHFLQIMPSLGQGQYFQNSINVDPLGVFVAVVATFLGFLIALFSIEYMKGDEAETRYYFLLQLFVGGMVLLVLAGDLVLLYFGWKIVGICSYFLIGHWYHKPDPQGDLCAKSGMKAFLMTLVGDVLLLAGLGILWLELGTININTIIAQFGTIDVDLQFWVALFIFAGAVGKSAQFPFITWLSSPKSINIDAMQGPTTVSALIHAACMVKAGVYLMSRFFFVIAPAGIDDFLMIFALIAAITAFIAAASALVAEDIKRVLAYSTVSQLAYMFMGLAVAYLAYLEEPAASVEGFMGGVFHLMSHAIFKALLFLSAGAIIHSLHHERNILKMGGLKNDLPVLRITTLIGVAGLLGFPFLTNGSFSKEAILASAYEFANHGHGLVNFGWLIYIIGILTAGLTAFYAVRFYMLIFEGKKPEGLKVHPPGPIMRGVTGLLALLVVITGITTPMWINDYFAPMFTGLEFHEPIKMFPESDAGIITFAIVVVMITIGIVLSYLIYRPSGPRTVMPTIKKHWYLRTPYVIAKEGFYLDAFYNGIIGLFDWANWKLRRLQTGDLNYNMSLLGAVGLGVVLILLFI